MELDKQTKTVDFKWKDITFKVRAAATRGDRHDKNMLLFSHTDGTGKVIPPTLQEVQEFLIRQFVTGWEGVEKGGKAVPFSWENLNGIPDSDVEGIDEDVIFLLGNFVSENCGLFSRKEAERKNA